MLGAYKQVVLTPHALPMIAVGFLGRLPLSMVGLGCLLVVEDYTGSYALGGAVAATGAVTTSLFGPLLGRAADAFGQRRVLLPTLAVFVIAGATFLWTVREDQPRWLMFLAAGVAGACIPPISSMLRTRWTYLLKGSPRLPTALAFESVMDEFTFIIGPVIVTSVHHRSHHIRGRDRLRARCCRWAALRCPAKDRAPAGRSADPTRPLSDANSGTSRALCRRVRDRRDPG